MELCYREVDEVSWGIKGKVCVLLVTHDFGVVAEVEDRVIVLKDGEIVEEGEVLNIFDNPQHPYTQELLSAI